MFAYLINATAVWLLALILFDGLFRRSGHHAANRAYLLGTFFIGIALPLIAPVMDAAPTVNPGVHITARLHRPIATQGVQTFPSAGVQSPAEPATTPINWMPLLYIIGVCFFAGKLAREGWLLYRLLWRSSRRVIQHQVVYETGGTHAPFSFFNRILLSSVDAFSEEELQMVLQHELRHARLLHSVDVLLLEALRIVLWFHPAIWLYARRLRAVHEFQADAVVRENRAAYGHFLLQQTLLGGCPILATSIIHSPIKTRIQMLTQTTTRSSWIYLAVLPLLAVVFVCCSRQDAKKETVKSAKTSVDGNVFEMSDMVQQNVLIRDASTGKVDTTFFTVLPQPTTMNGETIYHADNVTKEPQYAGPEASATQEIFKHITPDLAKLSDGRYFLMMPSIIVGKDGGVVYSGEADIYSSTGTLAIGRDADSILRFEQGRLSFSFPEYTKESIDINDRTRRKIIEAVNQVLINKLKFSPAQKDGKAVIAYAGENMPFGQGGYIVVENGVPKMADDFMQPGKN